MDDITSYENFPGRMILFSLLVTFSIYLLGAVIISGLGSFLTALYLLFCLGNEMHIMKMSCIDCYYYGRWCAFGRGKIASLLFKRGDPGRFIAKAISWKELLPDMLVLLVPLIAGIALMIRNFAWGTAVEFLALLALSFGGNYLVRSRIACKYCKQRELGCPAEQLFKNEKSHNKKIS